MSLTVDAIHRYPVKGLTPERLSQVQVKPGETLPADRRYAIENGPSGFDAAAPEWKAKTYYLMLMRDERLATLRSRYDDATHVLTIHADGAEVARGDLATPDGRAAIENYFARSFAAELQGQPKILHAEGYSFSDVPKKVISLINLASVQDVARMVGRDTIDPLRFRGNLHVAGLPAWQEFDLIGKTLAIGAARIRVVKRIVRCAAVNVDPTSGARDLQIPKTLMQNLGHMDCGVYGEVVVGGLIAEGDAIAIA
jgi:uncharacterized protein YcbX